MEFKKYQHVERLGTDEVRDILDGECVIFYKIDGTNSSVWLDSNENVCCGSRRRQLTLDNDNQGFMAHIMTNENVINYLRSNPTHRLYGEWLVPHSLKTYRENAWRKFYVFDVCKDTENDDIQYIPYDCYKVELDKYNIEYIPPIATILNPDVDSLYAILEKTNQFLVKDGSGNGEGIVIKNYDYRNHYGRQTWAKIVCSEFKEKHAKIMGVPSLIVKECIEIKIVEELCTEAFIEKEFKKLSIDGWSSNMIPRLLNTIYHELVKEEMWHVVKKYKNPTVNFKTLQGFITRKVKKVKSELF